MIKPASAFLALCLLALLPACATLLTDAPRVASHAAPADPQTPLGQIAGRVLDPAPDDAQAIAVRDTLALIGQHPRLDAAAIQTVGAKGWDGFAVAVVT